MKELILLVIGVLIIAYILDKKPPLPTKEGIEIIRDVRYSNHVINEEYTKYVEKLIKILKELNPLKHPVVWTYVEVQNENKGIQSTHLHSEGKHAKDLWVESPSSSACAAR